MSQRWPGPIVLGSDEGLALGAAQLGGKAASTQRLGALGLPGVVLPVALFEAWLWELPGAPALAARWATASDPETIADASAALQETLRSAPAPAHWPPLGAALLERLTDALGPGPYAVRSSAAGEDGATASFAGQLTSILDVEATPEALLDAVRACWASRYAPGVRAYELATGARLGGLAVLVQEMCEVALGGVLFTRDPADPTRARLEYVHGHLEGLVHGERDPGEVLFTREDRALEAHTPCPPFEAITPTFDEAAVERLALDALAHALTLESREDLFPRHDPARGLDLEIAITPQGDLRVLQCRPITTRAASPAAPATPAREEVEEIEATRGVEDDGPPVVFSSANMIENYPTPVTPMLYSIARQAYAAYFRTLGEAMGISAARIGRMQGTLETIAVVHHGRLYYNLSAIHACLREAPFGAHLARYFDQFIGAQRDLAAAPNADADATTPQEVARMLAMTTRAFSGLDDELDLFTAAIQRYAMRWTPERLAEATPRALVEDGLDAFLEIRLRGWRAGALSDTMVTITHGLLRDLLARGGVSEAETLSLIEGVDGLATLAPVEDLWCISRRALATPRAPERIRAQDLSLYDEADPLGHALRDYQKRWGFRASQELMLRAPRHDERPERLLGMLSGLLDVPDAGNPHLRQREAIARRVRATEAARDQLSRTGGLIAGRAAARTLDALLPQAHTALRRRERARLHQAMLYGALRKILLTLGDHLTRARLLDTPEDALMLEIDELIRLTSGRAQHPGMTRALVRTRREIDAADHARPTPPTRLSLSWGQYLPATQPHMNTDNHINTVHKTSPITPGLGASPGTARGRLVHVRTLDEAHRLRAGDLLVTRQTDPAWSALLMVAGGLIIERGGMLSHGAIVARELGIPAVLGVHDALQHLPDGALAEIDGTAGTVHLLPPQTPC